MSAFLPRLPSRFRRRRLLLLLLVAAVFAAVRWGPELVGSRDAGAGSEAVERAFRERVSGVWVEVEGTVERTLADDREGSRHQRFILRLASGQTLLVAHNIDLAERVPLREGDRVAVRGEYEWNERGGVLHWTHRDPRGRRRGGWVRLGEETYD